jgi:hypothetical protein
MLLDAPRLFVAISVVLLWLSAQVGAYASKKWRAPTEDERDDFNVVLSATLTLMGLIIGFTFSMAVSRYDQRKAYEEGEANAIGTEYLRVELLPTDAAQRAKDLLRQYLNQRIQFYQEPREDQLALIDAQTAQLQNKLWGVVLPAAAMQPTAAVALAVAGMNDVLNSQGYSAAAWRNRIPEEAWILVAAIAVCSCVLTGYTVRRARTPLFVILSLVLSVALVLVADIDSPRHGLIRVVPQNLQSLAESLRGQ